MRRVIALLLLLALATGAFATIPELRMAALEQLRSIAAPLFGKGESIDPHFDAFYAGMVEELPAQERAESALQLAINRYVGAAEYVSDNAASWRGTIAATPKLTVLVNAAIEAPLMEVRMAGFEVFLAQYGLEKTSAQVDQLIASWDADPAVNGPWMMWSMAMLGARGIERERIFARLAAALDQDDPALRRAAVDALARLGGGEVIAPLLEMAAHDPKPAVRERAFCGLAASGTLLIAERYLAVPGLLAIAESQASDQQNRDWSYQALKEITNMYDVPADPQSWRARLAGVGLLDPPKRG
jgi:hypothetical protein